MAQIKILAVGDVVGKPGREACKLFIPKLRKEEAIDFVVTNGENAAGGSGVTESTARDLFEAGIDVITSGDHIYKRKETIAYIEREERLLRPANYPQDAPGKGSFLWTDPGKKFSVGVVNVVGRVFLATADCPFKRSSEEIKKLKKDTPIILIDLHAEATSEKIAMGWYLDGEVSAVFGTHTHVQTADESILPKGTAYITDLGMTGPFKSVLGRDIKSVLTRLVTQVPARFEVAQEDVRLSGVIITVDTSTGKAIEIKRIQRKA